MNGDGLLTVGQLTKRTGLSRKALRLYEQAALVIPVTRSDAGYRLYDPNVLPRLELIRRARALDVGIGELGELLDMAEGRSERGAEDLSALVAQKLAQTRRRIEELQALEGQLRNVAQRLGRHAPAPRGNPTTGNDMAGGEDMVDRNDMVDRDSGSGCGSLLCTCPVPGRGQASSGTGSGRTASGDAGSSGPASSGPASGGPESSSRGGEDMNPIELREQTAESSSKNCECGCDCCAPQGDDRKDDKGDDEREREQQAAGGTCTCGCGD